MERKGPLKITYTGVLYKGRRDPDLLFQAIRSLIDQGRMQEKDIEVNFYGRPEPWLQNEIDKHGLGGVVKVHGQVSREESLQAQRAAHILLLLTWNNALEEGVLTGKVFDYLAACRPIVHLGYTNGSVSALLRDTRAGKDFQDRDELASYIHRCHSTLLESGEVEYDVDQQEIRLNNHQNMSKAFGDVLDSIVG